MAFALDPADPDIRSTLRRIACALIDAALDTPAAGPADHVHDLRKTVKKLRGLIRLVRPAMPVFAAENAALRDAGRGIAALRGAEVMVQVAHNLSDGLPEEQRAAVAAPFAAALSAAMQPEALAAQTAQFALALTAIRARAARWKLRESGFDALEPGLVRTWQEAQKALRRAERAPLPDHLHDWRKRVKDHWYQARLLSPVWPRGMAAHVALADELGEVLGQLNDLAEFAPRAAALPLSPALHEILAARIADRRADLQAQVFALGRPFLSEDATALAARWRGWWHLAA